MTFRTPLPSAPTSQIARDVPRLDTNPMVDELLYRIDRTLRSEERMALWAEANRILVDEVAYIPLYNFPYPYFVRKRVVGATPGNPINPPTYFVHTWDVQ